MLKEQGASNLRYYLVGLFFLFFSGYLVCSLGLSSTIAFKHYDILFELDTPRVVTDMAQFSGDHHRTVVHPIYVILVNPLGAILNLISGSPNTAAAIVNSILGALGVTMGCYFFWLYSKNLLNALLLSIFFGLTTSQFILSVMPETASLAIISLILNYTLLLHGIQTKKLHFRWWVVAGVLALGVTTTNFMQSLICFSVLCWILPEYKADLFRLRQSKVVHFGIIVVGITVVLSIVQRIIYPGSALFFNPNAYGEDSSYIDFLRIFSEPWTIIQQILKSFFVVDFIPPIPNSYFIPEVEAFAQTFSTSWKFLPVGIAAVVLWLGLWFAGVFKVVREKELRPLFIGLSLCLLFNLFFHTFYGVGKDDIYGVEVADRMEFFMFSGNFHFLILAFLSPLTRSKRAWFRWLLGLLILLTAVNNYQVFEQVYNVVCK